MSQYVETPTKAFTAGAAIDKYLRVTLSAGKLAAAGAYEQELGTMVDESFADGDVVAVRLRSAQGTQKMVASEAISQGAYVFAAASGKVSDVGFVPVGRALEAATADGDVIEVLICDYSVPATASIAAAGSAQGDAAALTSAVNTVSAADGTKGVILPAAAAGLVIEVYNEHASNGLKVYPATGDDINDGSANAAVTTEGKTRAVFRALDTATWAATFTANT